MVKKSSFLARLRERWSGSGVKVEERAERIEPRRSVDGRGAVQRVEAARISAREDVSSYTGAVDARTTRKLSEREEALVALGTHFQELAGLMRGVQTRMDGQVDKLSEAASSLALLPSLGNQQLELLRGLADRMDKQNLLGEQLGRTMATLPSLLQNVEGALARAAATDERTSQTMRDFQATMDRIHLNMGKMVEHSEQQANATKQLAERREDGLRAIAQGFEQTQRDTIKELRSATDEGLTSLRQSHEDQATRLHQVVEQHAVWNKVVVTGLGFVVLAVVALLVMTLAA